MNEEESVAPCISPWYRPENDPLHSNILKRKFGEALTTGRLSKAFSYPSPPMSRPPSPPQASTRPTLPSTPALASVIPSELRRSQPRNFSFLAPSLPPIQVPAVSALVSGSGTTLPYPAPFLPAATEVTLPPPYQTQQAESSGPGTQAALGPATLNSSRGGRKSKSHVASACVNCKRAHLSCDVQRPCQRCVASGKQETCHDVAHKKRGRPRLREEGESSKIDEPVTEQAGVAAIAAGPSRPTTRPIAQPRHRRRESLPSLRSETSEDSPAWSAHTPGFPPQTFFQSPVSSQPRQPPESSLAGYEVATAFLDLDFTVLRANQPFEQVIAASENIRGLQLAELVAPANAESFQAVRARLRNERDVREQELYERAYMPPILHSGEDPVQAIRESEIEQVTAGFNDSTYTWTSTHRAVTRQTFPARVRLANVANVYFVVVTLPTFRPADLVPQARPAQPLMSTFAPGSPLSATYGPPREPGTLSAPPFRPELPEPPRTAATSRTYPPPQAPMPYQQQQLHPAFQAAPSEPARLLAAEPPTITTPFARPREPAQVTQAGVAPDLQLPPILASSPQAGPSTLRRRESDVPVEAAGSAEEAGEEESPRKRRRMDIEDVLQR